MNVLCILVTLATAPGAEPQERRFGPMSPEACYSVARREADKRLAKMPLDAKFTLTFEFTKEAGH